MARSLRFLGVGRTDDANVPREDRKDGIVLRVVSEDLRSQPVHDMPLSRRQAFELIRELSSALARGES